MRRSMLNLGFALLVLSLVWACSPQQVPLSKKEPTATPALAKEAAVPRAVTAQPWERSWEELVTKAKKEGSVVVFSGAGPRVRQGLAPRLYERFGIRMEFITARGAQLSEKVTRERQAGIYSMDVMASGATQMVAVLKPKGFLDPLEPELLLPEVTDPKVWFKGELHFIDKERQVLSFTSYPNAPLGINTELVKPGVIKSYKDLLDPKWKGKLLMTDPSVGGTATKWFGVVGSKVMGWDFMRQIARQEPMIISDLRIGLEWLARGKYPILIAPHSPTMQEFREAGAPVADFTPEEGTYLTSGSGNVCLMNRAPHPNAARLFVNWLLTKEAGELWQRTMGQQSARLDVPADYMGSGEVRQPGVKYMIGDNEELLLAEPEYQKLAKEIFGPSR